MVTRLTVQIESVKFSDKNYQTAIMTGKVILNLFQNLIFSISYKT
jgi:hypothetical protein